MRPVAFPVDRRPPASPPDWREPGLGLRLAVEADLPFLRTLYRSFRAEEMAPVPWTQAAKDAFLDDQFRLQHQHFVTHFAGGDFFVVERETAPIGRLYLHRDDTGVLIVDIGFLPTARGQGLGQTLLEWTLRHAGQVGAPRVWLHVLSQNLTARRLYERLGFVVVGEDGAHLRMERPASRSSS